MAKVRLQATKMSDAKVEFISLVERGANRSPFKIIKQEPGMSSFSGIDLGAIFTRKSEKKVPEVFGIVTMKSEHLPDITSAVASSGFHVADMTEMEDQSVVFKQEGVAEGKGDVVRLNEHLAVIVKGAKLHDMDIQINEKAFKEAVAEQGYFPGVGDVMDGLSESVYEVITKAEDQAQAEALVQKMFAESAAYITSLVKALPAKAFKLEQVSKGKWKKMPEKEAPKVEEEEEVKKAESTEEVVVEKTEEVQPVAAVEQTAEVVAPAEVVEKAEKSLTETDVANIVSAQVDGVQKALIEKMEGLLGNLTQAVQKSAADVEQRLATIAGEVAQAKELAVKAETTVKSVVVTGANTDDHLPVKKTEMRAMGREIDTAFNKSARTPRR